MFADLINVQMTISSKLYTHTRKVGENRDFGNLRNRWLQLPRRKSCSRLYKNFIVLIIRFVLASTDYTLLSKKTSAYLHSASRAIVRQVYPGLVSVCREMLEQCLQRDGKHPFAASEYSSRGIEQIQERLRLFLTVNSERARKGESVRAEICKSPTSACLAESFVALYDAAPAELHTVKASETDVSLSFSLSLSSGGCMR